MTAATQRKIGTNKKTLAPLKVRLMRTMALATARLASAINRLLAWAALTKGAIRICVSRFATVATGNPKNSGAPTVVWRNGRTSWRPVSSFAAAPATPVPAEWKSFRVRLYLRFRLSWSDTVREGGNLNKPRASVRRR